MSLVRAITGHEHKSNITYMSMRERLDLMTIVLNFGVLVGVCVRMVQTYP